MTSELSDFAARLRERFFVAADVRRLTLKIGNRKSEIGNYSEPRDLGCYEKDFTALALELFALQFKHNAPYRRTLRSAQCIAANRGALDANSRRPDGGVQRTGTYLPAARRQRTTVFHSSGTTKQRPSRHFHSAESLAVYEASLWPWFCGHVVPDFEFQIANFKLAILTPPPAQAPHSSLGSHV